MKTVVLTNTTVSVPEELTFIGFCQGAFSNVGSSQGSQAFVVLGNEKGAELRLFNTEATGVRTERVVGTRLVAAAKVACLIFDEVGIFQVRVTTTFGIGDDRSCLVSVSRPTWGRAL
jgi:hypothetical protein